MRFLIQRVNHAQVTVLDETAGRIQKGFLVLIGISENDTKETADKLIRKLLNLRIFEDKEGKTNLSLKDVEGSLLPFTQTAKRGTAPLLRMQAALIWQSLCISIL